LAETSRRFNHDLNQPMKLNVDDIEVTLRNFTSDTLVEPVFKSNQRSIAN